MSIASFEIADILGISSRLHKRSEEQPERKSEDWKACQIVVVWEMWLYKSLLSTGQQVVWHSNCRKIWLLFVNGFSPNVIFCICLEKENRSSERNMLLVLGELRNIFVGVLGRLGIQWPEKLILNTGMWLKLHKTAKKMYIGSIHKWRKRIWLLRVPQNNTAGEYFWNVQRKQIGTYHRWTYRALVVPKSLKKMCIYNCIYNWGILVTAAP